MKSALKTSLFKINKRANVTGTCLQAEIFLSPKRLIEVFGLPFEVDENKVSGEYIFTSPEGLVFTLYDWKSTSLYADGLISPNDFWNQTNAVEFHIGAKSQLGVEEFKKFLISSCRNLRVVK